MSDDGAEVIQLHKSGEEIEDALPLRTERGPVAFCMHHKMRLDTGAQRVYCRDCGREVPAFEALEILARDPERYAEAAKAAGRSAKLAKARLDDLLREERNAKARKRRRERRVSP